MIIRANIKVLSDCLNHELNLVFLCWRDVTGYLCPSKDKEE
jgi:hypothetical protein